MSDSVKPLARNACRRMSYLFCLLDGGPSLAIRQLPYEPLIVFAPADEGLLHNKARPPYVVRIIDPKLVELLF